MAAYIFGEGFVKTDQFWSVTTSRHINKWLKDGHEDLPECKEIPQIMNDLYYQLFYGYDEPKTIN